MVPLRDGAARPKSTKDLKSLKSLKHTNLRFLRSLRFVPLESRARP